jgi:alpha-beta hydrolase superfamily lysophospholipase
MIARFFFAFLLTSLPSCTTLPCQQAVNPASSAYREREVQFPTDGLIAPGTLTLPGKLSGRVPILVLVQGSGVQDRDETIGPNKIFQQIARGLAERGIATLRYDRRAKFNLASFEAHPDLDHEVVIDAAAALAFCETIPEADRSKIYIAGHSLGAQLAPDTVALRLKQQPNSVAGMVLMSGIARPIDVVMIDQIHTLGKLQGGTPEQLDGIAAAWAAVFTEARDPKTEPMKPLGVGMKIPAIYWRDWLARDPVRTMGNIRVPALVLRGTNDLNSSNEDFDRLRGAATAKGSASRELSGLNHEYIPAPGDGSSTHIAGEVSAALLDVIAAWVKTGQLN